MENGEVTAGVHAIPIPIPIHDETRLGTAAIDWALDRLTPDARLRARARAVAAICLERVRASAWPEIAWRTSGLSGSGFPMEVSCNWTRPLVRYTTEVAGPEVAPAARLSLALELLGRLGSPMPWPSFLEHGQAAQRGGALRFGAWAGARHDGEGDRYKIYLEMPASGEAQGVGRALTGTPPGVRRAQLLVVACEPAAERVESYYRCLGLGGLGALLEPLGLGEQRAELTALGDELFARDATAALERVELGVSLSARRGQAPDRVTLYVRSALLFGGDARARERLLALGRPRGARLDAYAALTAGLDGAGTTEAHGLVALTAARAAPVDITVDLCPLTAYRAATSATESSPL